MHDYLLATKTLRKQADKLTLYVLGFFFCCTLTFSCYGVSVSMGWTSCETRSVVQSGLRVHAGITVVVVRAVAHGAVRVATQTLSLLFVIEEPLGTVQHTQALVEEVIVLTA